MGIFDRVRSGQSVSPLAGGGSGGGSGTVTSVALTVPGIFSVAGSPVTTSGTLAVSLATQTANKVFASAVSGGAAAPAFRALVAADIPSINDLLPSQATHAGEFLTTDGSVASWASAAGGGLTNPLANNTFLNGRNAANDGDINLIKADASDAVIVGKDDGSRPGFFLYTNEVTLDSFDWTCAINSKDFQLYGDSSGGATGPGNISFFDGDGDHFVKIKSPLTVASDITFVLPSVDGGSGDSLVTDGSGNLSFAPAGGTWASTKWSSTDTGSNDQVGGPFPSLIGDGLVTDNYSIFTSDIPLADTTTIGAWLNIGSSSILEPTSSNDCGGFYFQAGVNKGSGLGGEVYLNAGDGKDGNGGGVYVNAGSVSSGGIGDAGNIEIIGGGNSGSGAGGGVLLGIGGGSPIGKILFQPKNGGAQAVIGQPWVATTTTGAGDWFAGGASGSFTTVDLKTVTVVSGLITAIV